MHLTSNIRCLTPGSGAHGTHNLQAASAGGWEHLDEVLHVIHVKVPAGRVLQKFILVQQTSFPLFDQFPLFLKEFNKSYHSLLTDSHSVHFTSLFHFGPCQP